MASGRKTKNEPGRLFLKGLVDDVMLHHYWAYDIYWEFSDAVYVTIPATAVCDMQMMTPALRIANCITARCN